MFQEGPLNIRPGVYKNGSVMSAAGRWTDAPYIRWRDGLAEKIGGWQAQNTTTIEGICRKMHPWLTNDALRLIGLGTHLKLYIYRSGDIHDVTPMQLATDGFGGGETELSNPFTTGSSGSPLVTVAHTSHPLKAGDRVHFDCTSATFDGVTIDGEYEVTSITSANAYVITASTNCTSGSTNGGGTVDYGYEVATGSPSSTTGLGWGAGTWGQSTWGTPRDSSEILIDARVWSIDNWGEDMIACPRGGGLYVWDRTNDFSTRAVAISGAPSSALGVFVSPEDRHLFAYGAHDGTAVNKMLVRWCDQEDYTAWTPASTNTAGDKILQQGTEIIGHCVMDRGTLLGTDTSLYHVYFIGGNDVFAIEHLGKMGGVVSPNAMVDVGPFVAGMSRHGFFIYDGAIRDIPCDVYDFVFRKGVGYNRTEGFKVYCGIIRDHHEVWWAMPIGEENDEVTHQVTWNWLTNEWGVHPLVRTAWAESVKDLLEPHAAGTDGYIYAHEFGDDADGSAMEWSMQSGYYKAPGDFTVTRRLIPDFKDLTGNVSVSVKGKRYPQSSAIKTKGPETVTSTTKKVGIRCRDQYQSLYLEGSDLGQSFRMDAWQVSARQHGAR